MKRRLVATVDEKVCAQIDIVLSSEMELAVGHDRVQPNQSNVVEMLLRKGIRAYKSEHKA